MPIPDRLAGSSRCIDHPRYKEEDFTAVSQTTSKISALTPLFSMNKWFGSNLWGNSSHPGDDNQYGTETTIGEEYSMTDVSNVEASTASAYESRGYFTTDDTTQSGSFSIAHLECQDTESVSRADETGRRRKEVGGEIQTDQEIAADDDGRYSSVSVGEFKRKSDNEYHGPGILMGLCGWCDDKSKENLHDTESLVSSTGTAKSKGDLETHGSKGCDSIMRWEEEKYEDVQSPSSMKETQKPSKSKSGSTPTHIVKGFLRWVVGGRKRHTAQPDDLDSKHDDKKMLHVDAGTSHKHSCILQKHEPCSDSAATKVRRSVGRSRIPTTLPKPKANSKRGGQSDCSGYRTSIDNGLEGSNSIQRYHIKETSFFKDHQPFDQIDDQTHGQTQSKFVELPDSITVHSDLDSSKSSQKSQRQQQPEAASELPLKVFKGESRDKSVEPNLTVREMQTIHSVPPSQPIVKTGDFMDSKSGISTQNESENLHVVGRKKYPIGLASSIGATQIPTSLGKRLLTRSRKSAFTRGFAKRWWATKKVSNPPAEKVSDTAGGDSPKSTTPGIVSQLISYDADTDTTTSPLRSPNQLRHIIASFKAEKRFTRPSVKRTNATGTDRDAALSSSAANEIRLALKSISANRRLRARKQQNETPQKLNSLGFCERCSCICSE